MFVVHNSLCAVRGERQIFMFVSCLLEWDGNVHSGRRNCAVLHSSWTLSHPRSSCLSVIFSISTFFWSRNVFFVRTLPQLPLLSFYSVSVFFFLICNHFTLVVSGPRLRRVRLKGAATAYNEQFLFHRFTHF